MSGGENLPAGPVSSSCSVKSHRGATFSAETLSTMFASLPAFTSADCFTIKAGSDVMVVMGYYFSVFLTSLT